MKNRERFLAAHYQSGFYAKLRFQLLDEIDKKSQSQAGIWTEHGAIIDELAKGITDGTLTRYNLDNDYVIEKYGLEENNPLSYLICEAAFYQAGCDATEKHSKPTLEYLEEIEENMDGGFFVSYQPEEETLADLVKSFEGKALEIAEKSRSLDRQKGALKRFCETLDGETEEDEIIGKINLYNDGSYLELVQSVQALAYLLERRENWETYYKLLDVLKYFPLQGGVIKDLRNVEDVLAVIRIVEKHNGRKSLHYLLREQCYKLFCEEEDLLKGNLEDELLPDTARDYITDLIEQYEKVKPTLVKEAVDVWLRVFCKEDLTAWLSKKKAEAGRKHPKYGKPELDIVQMMSQTFSLTDAEIDSFALDEKDFQTLITLASNTNNKDVCKKLILALSKNIFADRSYPPTTLNDLWFEQTRTIYQCLRESELDGLAILKEYRKPFEGYKVDLGVAMRTARQESYWLAVLLMSLEESDDEALFDKYIDVLFKDTQYAVDSLTDDVFTPYYVAELLVSQALTGKKETFEKRLIKEIPYLVFIIRVLTGNDGVMSDDVKQLLAERIKADWESERKLLSQRKVKILGFYDEYVKEYLK